jgi:ribosomal protein L12E/L44/L45/RPP1/RPP2
MAESLELITDLKPGQARQITEKIKRGIGEVADLIRIAHEGRAWAALGYETAQAWLRAEFEGASRGKVWRLETQLHVIEAIQRETGEVVEVSAREAEAVAKEARRSGKRVSEVAQARRARATRPFEVDPLDDSVEVAEIVSESPGVPALADGEVSWLAPLRADILALSVKAGISTQEWIMAALVAGVEGVTVNDVIERGKIRDFDGEPAARVAEKLGVAKSTVQARQKRAAAAVRCEFCGSPRGTHQRWCQRKAAS